MIKSDNKTGYFLSFGVFAPILFFCLGYIIFKRDFAETNFSFPFLNFPIFIGELLLAWCVLILVVARFLLPEWRAREIPWIAAFCVVWFSFKVAWGYWIWGPLAFRHAALFYYSIFLVVGYLFFRKDLFNRTLNFVFFAGLIVLFVLRQYDMYWSLSLGCFAVMLILKMTNRKIAWAMMAVLALVFPYQSIFQTARMMLVGNLAAIILLISAFLYLSPLRKLVKLGIILILCGGIIAMFNIYFVQGRSGRTFSSIGAVKELFLEKNRIIESKKSDFKMVEVKPKLYNPEPKPPCLASSLTVRTPPASSFSSPPKTPFVSVYNIKTYSIASPMTTQKAPETVDFNGVKQLSAVNIVFRLFIWRDMIHEFLQHKPVFGFNFGRPLRSESLEIINWGDTEWSRDGWIEPHNSYLNIIYRAGIFGILMIIFIIAGFVRLIATSIRSRSWTMFLLTAAVLNWLVAANFLVVLELPYTAIPVWLIFGLTLAYSEQLKNKFA